MNRLSLFFGFIVAISTFSACNHLSIPSPLRIEPSDLTQFPQHRFINLVLPDSVHQVWEKDIEATVSGDNILGVSGALWVFNRKGTLKLIQAKDGKSLGEISLARHLNGGVLWHEQQLIVPHASGKSTLSKFDIATKTERWKVSGPNVEVQPIIWQNQLVSATSGGKIQFRNLENGVLKAEFPIATVAQKVLASPILSQDTLFVVDEIGNAMAMTSSGVLWQKAIGNSVETDGLYFKNQVILPTTRGKLITVNLKDGTISELFNCSDATVRFTTLAVHQNAIWFGATDGFLRSIDLVERKLQHQIYIKSPITAPPLALSNRIVIGTLKSEALLISPDTGEVLQRIRLRGRVKSTPFAYHNKLYFVTEPHHLIAFE